MIELALWVAGVGQIVLALMHVALPRKYGWREIFARVDLLSRQLFFVHTFFVAFMVALFGILSCVLAASWPNADGPVVVALLACLAVLWGTRLVFQFFVFDRALWKGNRRRTWLHALATFTWVALTTTYAWACWVKMV